MPADARTTALQPFWDRPTTSGLFSDYDGTLAPIVLDPSRARAFPGAIDTLAALVSRVGRVGVISGRPASFLVEHFGGRGLHLSGLYGLETVAAGSPGVVLSEEAASWAIAVEEAARRAESDPGGAAPGLGVERKGLALTLHFRRDPSLESAARRWAAEESARSGLVAHTARMAVELRPPLPASKGTALMAAATGLDRVCFIGDDFADLDAFDAIDLLARDGVHGLRVAVASDEGPQSLLERADVVVEGVAGAVDLLGQLLAGYCRTEPD